MTAMGRKQTLALLQNFLSYRLYFMPAPVGPDSFGTRLILLLNSERGIEGNCRLGP